MGVPVVLLFTKSKVRGQLRLVEYYYVRVRRTVGECEKSRLRAIKLFVVCKSGGGGG